MRTLLLGTLTLALVCLGTGPVLATDDGLVHGLPAGGGPILPETGDGSLTTIFASNNGFAGNSFDLTAHVDLTVVGFDCNLDTGTWDIDIWTRDGTASGHEQNPAEWTLLGSDTGIISNGVDVPTHVNVGGLGMTAGQLVGCIAILQPQHYSAFNYTNGGPNDYSNADMTITTYAGLGDGWPPSNLFNGRIWNGTVHYDYSATPVDATTWGAIKAAF